MIPIDRIGEQLYIIKWDAINTSLELEQSSSANARYKAFHQIVTLNVSQLIFLAFWDEPGYAAVSVVRSTTRYIKPNRAIPTPKKVSAYIAHIFRNGLVIWYEVANMILLHDGQWTVRTFFVYLCNWLGVEETTVYYSQRNVQLTSYNRKSVVRLWLYAADSKKGRVRWTVSLNL